MASRDPTQTTRLRQMFRGEAQRRIRTLLTATQDLLVEQGALNSLTHPMALIGFFQRSLPTEASTRLDVFTGWFNRSAYETIVSGGNWLRAHTLRAYQHGLRAGEHWSKKPLLAQPDEIYHRQYLNELEGIVDATVQQATRAVSTGLLNRESGSTIYRRIVAVTMKVTQPRLYMLGHQLVVQQHNSGLLAQFRAMGVRQVGVIPETIPSRKLPLRRDHVVRDDDEVNVITYGDDRVCDACQDYADSGPHDLDEVEAVLPLHIKCRCAWVPSWDKRFAINKVRTLAELEAEE